MLSFSAYFCRFCLVRIASLLLLLLLSGPGDVGDGLEPVRLAAGAPDGLDGDPHEPGLDGPVVLVAPHLVHTHALGRGPEVMAHITIILIT